MQLFTVGHSTHSAHHFVGLLTAHNITAVGDVRSVPYSRYNPQFGREAIAESLKAHNIVYVHLGDQLGARSENPDCYVDGKVQFDRLACEASFQRGIARLKTGMQHYRIALMCAEKDPIICHRMILVAHHLRDAFAIQHITADGALESNAAAETRLRDALNIAPDLIRDEAQCIADAYRLQSRRIAYTRDG